MFAVTRDIRLMGKKALALTGLRRGNSSSSSAPKQEGDVKEITVWAWGPTLTQVAKDFKKETGINVNLVNTGQGNKTWDEFYQDAKKIHALGDNYYITSDTGVAGFYDSMTWLASATLFSTEGETVTINLTGAPKVKARGIFGDYLGKSYTGNQKLSDGVAAWEQALKDYAKDQGYIVK